MMIGLIPKLLKNAKVENSFHFITESYGVIHKSKTSLFCASSPSSESSTHCTIYY